jgi:hypothetical protein
MSPPAPKPILPPKSDQLTSFNGDERETQLEPSGLTESNSNVSNLQGANDVADLQGSSDIAEFKGNSDVVEDRHEKVSDIISSTATTTSGEEEEEEDTHESPLSNDEALADDFPSPELSPQASQESCVEPADE